MELTILFWFYKEIDICKNRLEIIRKYNPTIKIWGLYGGKTENESEFKQALSPFLDDFYTSLVTDSDSKWINGDLMLLEWFEHQGHNLEWDSIAVIQWDMLFFDNVWNVFQGIAKDQIFLSGLKYLDRKTELSWDWTKPGTEERKNFDRYLDYVKTNYNYTLSPLCCLFILEVFPRIFFEKYLTIQDKAIGMLEYKIPNYAKIFNIPFYERDMGVSWDEDSKMKPLNAIPEEIERTYILDELNNPNGWRVFHPYFKVWE